MNAETLAQLFHETYERRAPEFGYKTRKETAIPWNAIPADNANKRLMIAVAGEVLKVLEHEAVIREYIDDATGYRLTVEHGIVTLFSNCWAACARCSSCVCLSARQRFRRRTGNN